MRRSYFIFGLVALLAAAGFWTWSLVQPAREAPDYATRVAIGGPFTLVDHNGKTVTWADFRGRYVLIFFGYTFCPDVCPTSMMTVSQALDLLGPKAGKVQPLFISVDPERDTPETLKSFVENFHPRLTGLTGSPEQVAAAAKAFKVYYKKMKEEGSPDDEYLVNHSTSVYLMDPQGEFSAVFSYETAPEAMAEKIGTYL